MDCLSRVLCDGRTGDQGMINAFLMLGGMALFAALLVGYDLVAEHVNRRRAHKH